MPTIEDILLAYGPLGVMTLVSGYVVWYLWKELKAANLKILEVSNVVRDAEIDARQREIELLKEMAVSELEDKEQYLKLCAEIRTTLERLRDKLDEIAKERYR